jgi:hypothetical protein
MQRSSVASWARVASGWIAIGLRDIHLVEGLQPGYGDRLTSSMIEAADYHPAGPWCEPVWPLWDVAIRGITERRI